MSEPLVAPKTNEFRKGISSLHVWRGEYSARKSNRSPSSGVCRLMVGGPNLSQQRPPTQPGGLDRPAAPKQMTGSHYVGGTHRPRSFTAAEPKARRMARFSPPVAQGSFEWHCPHSTYLELFRGFKPYVRASGARHGPWPSTLPVLGRPSTKKKKKNDGINHSCQSRPQLAVNSWRRGGPWRVRIPRAHPAPAPPIAHHELLRDPCPTGPAGGPPPRVLVAGSRRVPFACAEAAFMPLLSKSAISDQADRQQWQSATFARFGSMRHRQPPRQCAIGCKPSPTKPKIGAGDP